LIDLLFTSARLGVTLPSFSTYILVFHGSHDPRSQQAASQLTDAFRQRIQQTDPVIEAIGEAIPADPVLRRSFTSTQLVTMSSAVKTGICVVQDAYLECHSRPLVEQIDRVLRQSHAIASSITVPCQIIPVFLLAGTHVMVDLPAAIAAVQTSPNQMLTITPHLGSHPGLKRLLNECLSPLPMEAWILLAHGSRRSSANQAIEQLALDLGTVTAYWSTAPSLETRIHELAASGLRKIGILPYFLFSGAITDAIAQGVAQLRLTFPNLTLTLAQPLDVKIPELADLLVDLAVGRDYRR
jgi:sirohydrochlorin ferrochelatase